MAEDLAVAPAERVRVIRPDYLLVVIDTFGLSPNAATKRPVALFSRRPETRVDAADPDFAALFICASVLGCPQLGTLERQGGEAE